MYPLGLFRKWQAPIWIFKDRETHVCTGKATVTFEDEASAEKAVTQFNGNRAMTLFAQLVNNPGTVMPNCHYMAVLPIFTCIRSRHE